MSEPHAHAAAVDRLGRAAIRNHFGISDAAITYWRQKGIPRLHHNTLRILADRAGVALPELDA